MQKLSVLSTATLPAGSAVKAGVAIGNVQAIIYKTKQPARVSQIQKEVSVEASRRAAQLEAQLNDLWHHYAASRKQKLELLDANAQLESAICKLRRELAYEVRQREVAEAKLQSCVMVDSNGEVTEAEA